VNLTAEDLKNHSVMVGEHKNEFTDNDVITGMARADLGQRGADVWQLLNRGEVAMLTWFAQDLSSVGSAAGIDPNMVSWCPFPAGPGGKRVVQVQQHYAVMCEAVRDRPKNERDKVWETLTALCEQRVFDDIVRRKVLTGEARFVNPQDLTRLGFGDYLKDVPDAIRQNYREIDSGKVATYTEPFMGFWATMDEAISREMVSLVLAETGENFDYAAALRKVQNDANSGKMFQRSKQELNRYRPTARIVIAIMAIVFCVFMVLIIRSYTIHRGGTIQQVYRGWLPWAMAAPALILIGLWGYYPLMRGSVMAFQDYKIAGASAFVGLDNFITLALDRSFWTSMARTVYFVLLNVTFAFLAPIILAILLSEIKRAKIFYRTLFFLPQVTSAIVIALLWKLMYDPTPFGLFNQLFGLLNYLPFVHFEPKTWLQDPKLAMVCCVIPTVWASMGMSSLIYLAALRAFPRTATKPTTWTARECGRSWGGSRCRRCSR
jgi:multiple sugar transport system permease protein